MYFLWREVNYNRLVNLSTVQKFCPSTCETWFSVVITGLCPWTYSARAMQSWVKKLWRAKGLPSELFLSCHVTRSSHLFWCGPTRTNENKKFARSHFLDYIVFFFSKIVCCFFCYVCLKALLRNEQVMNVPILILGNKIDRYGAVSEAELRHVFGLSTTGKVGAKATDAKNHHIYPLLTVLFARVHVVNYFIFEILIYFSLFMWRSCSSRLVL